MNRQADLLSVTSLLALGRKYARQVGSSIFFAARRWQMDDAASMAAAVAYYLALSIFPLWLLLTSGIGIALRYTRLGQDAEEQIFAVVAEHCSPSLEAQVRGLLIQLEDHSTITGPVGLLMAALAAIGVFYQFERGFDKIWRIPPPSSKGLLSSLIQLLTKRLVAFCMLACVGLGIIATLAVNVAIGSLERWMSELHIPGVTLVMAVDAAATTLLNAVAFGLIYRWLPKRPVRWSDALRGGLLVALIWEVGRQILGAFLIRMTYTSAYGAAGSLIALLLWFYWGVTIIFFGAEYVQVLSRHNASVLGMFKTPTVAGVAARRPTIAE